MRKAIHDTTAQICKDMAEPPHDLELIEPNPFRRCARLLVIFAVGAFLVAAIVILAIRIPEFQAEKKTISSKEDLPKLLCETVKDNQSITCPCKNQVMSWCEITIFHIYAASDGQSIDLELNYTMDQAEDRLANDICGSTDPMAVTICMHILSPLMDMADSRTYLPTANVFTRPELLYTEIATRIDTNAYEQSNSYTFLEQDKKKAGLYNYSISLIRLVRDMSFQFNKSSSSSREEFWKASNETRNTSGLNFGFGMDVNWDTYLRKCDAAFCDVEFKVSLLNRVLRAMGQVGGITTVVSLALKFLIWPGFRIVLRFPASKHA